jgi:hypothetical protein
MAMQMHVSLSTTHTSCDRYRQRGERNNECFKVTAGEPYVHTAEHRTMYAGREGAGGECTSA